MKAGKVEEVRAVVDNLKMTSHLANVGDCKTLVIHPWVTTHQQMPDEEKIKGGVTRTYILTCFLLFFTFTNLDSKQPIFSVLA